jgi:hypothetical protein
MWSTSIGVGDGDRLCLLVVIGVWADGVRGAAGGRGRYRESAKSRASLLRDLKRCGLNEPRRCPWRIAAPLRGAIGRSGWVGAGRWVDREVDDRLCQEREPIALVVTIALTRLWAGLGL